MLLQLETAAVLVRPVAADDADALAQLFARCSDRTRYQRFHGIVSALPVEYLDRCRSGEHDARVAELVTPEPVDTPHLIGLASAGPALGAPYVHEVGVFVEDAWQHRGIGRGLIDDVLAAVRSKGVAVVRMELCRAQPGLISYLLAHLSVVAMNGSGCDVTLDADVPGALISQPPRRSATVSMR